ncbi:MAG: biopolymer transporter ExbD [Phycisphaerae bacterium]|nr:biopolymer transporter ExbD [Gemmatimonadaceae bacterium]
MSMSAGGGAAVKAEPNVTPMIDVMLVLLIIFMIVVPTISAGFNAVPPEAQSVATHPEDEENDQVLGIDSDGNYYLNKRPIAQDKLGEAVKAIFENREEHIMYVKAHKELKYVKVIDAMDILAHNGVAVAALITEQKPGTESLVDSDRIKPGTK